MSKVHIAKQGFLTKSALPNVSRTFPTESSLLLLGSGTNGQTTFTDSSVNNYTINRVGDTVISTAQFPTGMTSSIFFDGTGDALTTTPSDWFSPGTNNFTMECWFYSSSTVSATAHLVGSWLSDGISNPDLSVHMGLYATNGVFAEFRVAGVVYDILSTANVFTINTWNHLALVRNGNIFTLYLNGISRGTRTQSGTILNTPQAFTIGAAVRTNGTYYQQFAGYLSNIRVTLGTAIYTSNFDPQPLPLQNNGSINANFMANFEGTNGQTTFTDSSVNNFSITGVNSPSLTTTNPPTGMTTSLSLNGTNGTTTPYNSQFAFPGNFTVELYLNFSAHQSFGGIISCSQAAAPNGWAIVFNDIYNDIICELASGGTVTNIISTTTISPNTWTHIAMVRNGSTITLYIAGTARGTATRSATFDSTNAPLKIGLERSVDRSTTGLFSNVRITKGLALYTANFTPPALPLPNNIGGSTSVTNNTYGVYQNY